ncbi:MAG: thioredoxin [Patescibacteria group bacterium]
MVKIIELDNKEDFDSTIKTGTTLVDFYAQWCGPCQAMKPVVDRVSEEIDGVKFLSVDVDKFSDIAQTYQVMSIPTFVIIKDSEVKSVKNGAMSESDFKTWVEKNK